MSARIAIFVSGSGTNMVNLIEQVQAKKIDCEVALVVCDRPAAPAIGKAIDLGVPVEVFDRKTFESKADFEAAIKVAVDSRRIDWILLAGFMRILSTAFVLYYWGRIINIHPSLLPKYPGAAGIKDTFEAGEKEAGVTTHFVVPEVDAGPIIMQRACKIDPQETLETLEEKVHAIEYEIYPETLRRILSGQVQPPAQN